MRTGTSYIDEIGDFPPDYDRIAIKAAATVQHKDLLEAIEHQGQYHLQKLPFGERQGYGTKGIETVDPVVLTTVSALNAAERLAANQRYFPAAIDDLDPAVFLAPLTSPGDAKDRFISQQARNPNRCLLGPSDYPDKVLKAYGMLSLRTALSDRVAHADDPSEYGISPVVVATYAGCKEWQAIQRGADRVLALLSDTADSIFREHPARLSDVFSLVGFGPGRDHTFLPHMSDETLRVVAPDYLRQRSQEDHHALLRNVPDILLDGTAVEMVNARRNRISPRRAWLSGLPDGADPQEMLLRKGAFAPEMNYRLRKLRIRAARNAQVALSTLAPQEGYPMGEAPWHSLNNLDFYQYCQAKKLDETVFNQALARVYERPWLELDLRGLSDLQHDNEVVLARSLMSAMIGTNGRRRIRDLWLSASQLLGLSVLSGIPVVAFVQFALNELRRTGETFLNAGTVTSLLDGINQLMDSTVEVDGIYVADQVGLYYACGDRLEYLLGEFEMYEAMVTAKPRKEWALKLRRGKNLLWSHRTANIWSINSVDDEGRASYVSLPDRKIDGCM